MLVAVRCCQLKAFEYVGKFHIESAQMIWISMESGCFSGRTINS